MRGAYVSLRVLLWRVLAACALGGFLGLAQAASTTVIPSGTTALNYVTGGVEVIDGSGGAAFIGRTFADPAVSARTIGLSETLRLPPLGGNALTVTSARTLTAGEVAGAAVAVGAAAYAGCALGTAIANYAGMGSGSNGSRVSCNVSDWLFDPGTAPTPMTQWCQYVSPIPGGTCATSPDLVFAAQLAYLNAHPGNGCTINYQQANMTYKFIGSAVQESASMWHQDYGEYCGQQLSTTGTFKAYSNGTTMACQASTDALNPAFNVAAGAAPGPDGKCPTGRYNSMTPDQAKTQLGQYGDASKLKDLANDILNKNGTITTADSRHLSGPASLSGSPTTSTTTNPDGTTSTTTSTPTTNYTYAGDTINYSTTNVTTINNNGQTTTTTTNTPAGTQDQKDPCSLHPDSAGCVSLGTPTDQQVQKSTQNLTFTPVSFVSGSCPADVTFSAFGHAYAFTMQPLCDACVNWVKPIVLILGASVAAYVFIGGLKA